MLGFVAGICEPEGHWLSVEPVDSKSFLEGREERRLQNGYLGFSSLSSVFPPLVACGVRWPLEVSEFLLGVQSQGLVQFAGRLLGQVALGEASWR